MKEITFSENRDAGTQREFDLQNKNGFKYHTKIVSLQLFINNFYQKHEH